LPGRRAGIAVCLEGADLVERLDIYAHMYFARLIEVMEEYPTMADPGAHEFAALPPVRHASSRRTLGSLSGSFRRAHLPHGHRHGLRRTSRASSARWKMCSMPGAPSR
jgi:hypothetical protein